MKNIIIILLSFLLVGCSTNDIVSETEKINLDFDYTVTSDSISFNMEEYDTDLKYKLYLDNNEVSIGNVNEENIINELESNREYTLEIYTDENKTSKKITTEKLTKLRFGGDVMMTSYFANYIASNGVGYMWEDVSDLIKSADYSIFNLETSVSDRGSDTKPAGYGFRSNPNTLQGLQNIGIDMVNLANNHVLDYGSDAFLDTLDNVKKYKIEYIGAGKDYNEASEIKYETINDIEFSFIGMTSILGYQSWKATENKEGVFYLTREDYENIFNQVKEANENSDYVVIFTHWDREYYNTPTNETIDIAHKLIDNGADIIIGTHPHVLQGVEYYNKGIIYYSLGNFNFLIKNDNASQTGLFELNLDSIGIKSSKIYPVRINNCKANLLDSSDNLYSTIITNLNERSKIFNTTVTNDGYIKKLSN